MEPEQSGAPTGGDKASETLRPLPPWFHCQQDSDTHTQSGRPIPCKIFLYTQNGTLIAQFGEAAHNSAFRFRPSTMTTFTNFSLEVRQNFNGDGKIEVPKSARGLSKTGRDLHHFPETYLEDALEFDLDNFCHLQVSIIENNDDFPKKVPAEAITDFTAPGGRCGFLECILKPKMRPVRTYGQQDTFDTGSDAEKFFSLVRSASRFRIFVRLARKNKKIDDEEVFTVFKHLVNDVRGLGRDGVPRSDWHFSRDPHYAPNSSSPFAYYINNVSASLPVPPWLVLPHKQCAQLYHKPLPLTGVPRKTFPSLKFYTSHFIPALLQEREEFNRQLIDAYSDRYHPAFIVNLGERQCFIQVKLIEDPAKMGATKIIRQPGRRCDIRIEGLSTPDQHDTSITGRVSERVHHLFDFAVEAEIPVGLVAKGFDLSENHEYLVSLTFHAMDLDIEQKLACLVELHNAPFWDRPTTRPASQAGQRQIDNFRLQNIIGEQDLDTYSPDLVQELKHKLESMSDVNADAICEEASTVADALLRELDPNQTSFLNHILSGVVSNLALLEGLPGTGKSHTLAGGIVYCIASGKKILAVAQSNAGVDELFRQVCKTIQQHLPPAAARTLLAKCTRMAGVMNESAIAKQLAHELDIHALQGFSLAARTREYIEKNPTSQNVIDYQQHMSTRRQGRIDPHYTQRSFHELSLALQREVLGTMSFVACTTYTAGTLRDVFEAEVLVIDEAAQAGELDALVALRAQPNLQLVVMAGDIQQLGPVVISEQASKNMYGYILKESMMKRVQVGYPHLARVRLNANYRGHPSTIAMASEIFYNGDLIAAPGLDWNTALARRVALLLSGPKFNKTINLAGVLNDSRQLFFDVVGQPTQRQFSSSWTNKEGVTAVLAFVQLLLTDADVRAADIGIISMYKDDLCEIKSRLDGMGLTAVPEVATVDAFQGREKRIMIVHFVAAFADKYNPFGFVAKPNRLCVATTRSQEYQFLFGNLTFWARRLKDPTTARDFKAIDKMVQYVRKHSQVVQWKDVAV